MTTRQVIIQNKYGIHCRPAAIIAREAQAYPGSIKIGNDQGTEVNAKNIIGLISLGIAYGQQVTVTVEGENENETAELISGLLQKSFDFSR